MFSKACEYGIRAMTFIASASEKGRRVSLKEIAEEIDSPSAFTAKILQQLSKNSLVDSSKGPFGGFLIPLDRLNSITLQNIVFAIDGDAVYNGCGLGLKQCSEKQPCPVHFEFKKVRDDLKKMLQSTSIQDLASKLNNKTATLKR
ncbi:MAG: Rrf2 family transcriptional regulator [Bacteroidetes bacterium]|nr:MAG: Rrf2 family transcriptional regulator [Bacteroidota bacterium]